MEHALKFRPYSGAIAKHYKGGVYTILGTARHTETREELIIYRDSGNRIHARPAAMFFEYLEEQECHRFEFVGRESSPSDTKVNLI
ncbi:DUF1653 domain-containing protein [Bacillus mycoides]|uniref:DUF1653 domain-containing protein n=1 Tax=Bacillus mycoides TaxID=1405 RepID=UPI002E1EF08A|nr:DUF1653 domain-containing protein [Bacillus mycoides]MED1054349.1 DUF1653 domain-containing protein [Bacillus mycoides]